MLYGKMEEAKIEAKVGKLVCFARKGKGAPGHPFTSLNSLLRKSWGSNFPHPFLYGLLR